MGKMSWVGKLVVGVLGEDAMWIGAWNVGFLKYRGVIPF